MAGAVDEAASTAEFGVGGVLASGVGAGLSHGLSA